MNTVKIQETGRKQAGNKQDGTEPSESEQS